MILYVLFALLLFVYLEVLGTVFNNRFNFTVFTFNAVTGLFLFLGAFFILLFLPLYFKLNQSWLIIMGIIIFLISLLFIIKNYKYLKLRFHWSLLIVLGLVGYGLYKAYITTLGPNSYDSSFYINYISNLIAKPNLNNFEVSFNTTGVVAHAYYYQVFYHFSAFFVEIFQKIAIIFQRTYYVMPGYVWLMTTLFLLLSSTSVINFLHYFQVKNKFIWLITLLITIFFLSLHWNNSLAFMGNTYRTLCCAYFCFYLWLHFKNHQHIIMLFISSIALVAVSSTSLFILILALYAMFIIDYQQNDYLYRDLALLMIIPLANLIFVVRGYNILICYLVVSFLALSLYFFNNSLLKLSRKYKLNMVIGLFVIVVLIALSYRASAGYQNFNAFFHSLSGKADMTWQYFRYSYGQYILFNISIYLLCFIYFLQAENKVFRNWLLVLVLTFFNPFTTAIINEYMPVYYRALDLVINPFTIVLFAVSILKLENVFKNIVLITLCLALLYPTGYYIVNYDRNNLIPESDYNNLYKMNNDELEMILYVNNIIEENKMKDVKVYLHTLYFNAFSPNSFNLFNRFRTFRSEDAADSDLYELLYYIDFKNYPDEKVKEFSLDEVEPIIRASHYDFVSDTKNIEYFNEEIGYYDYRYKRLKYYYPDSYENDTYFVVRTYLNE